MGIVSLKIEMKLSLFLVFSEKSLLTYDFLNSEGVIPRNSRNVFAK
jgi:hypothetical protein